MSGAVLPVREGPTPLFGAYGIVKRFGDFTANDGVDLEIRAGTISTRFSVA